MYNVINNRKKRNVMVLMCVSVILLIIELLQVSYRGALQTMILFVFSFFLLNHIKVKAEYVSRYNIYIIFLLRLFCILIIYELGWKTSLFTSSFVEGYDPARYYYMANTLIDNHFIPSAGSLNYYGIVYWYAILFVLFGRNPISVIIVNSVMSIVSAGFIVDLYDRCSKSDYNRKENYKKKIFLLYCFFPEILWFDSLSSRETVCLMLLLVIVRDAYILFFDKNNASQKYIWIVLLCLFLLGIIRTSMLVVALAILGIFAFLTTGRVYIKILMVVGFMFAFVFIFLFSSFTASSSVNLLNAFSTVISSNSGEGGQWSANSIGRLLVADNKIKLLYIWPFRIIAYLVLPLPNIRIHIWDLLSHNYAAYQDIFQALSSIVYLMGLPSIISEMISLPNKNIKKNKDRCIMDLITFVIIFSVACGTMILHIRYRIVAVPFIILSIFLGKETLASNRKVITFFLIFSSVPLGSFYVLYKFGIF